MEYLNIPNNFARQPEFIGADEDQRGVWISLLSFCTALENSGRIPGCRGWNARQWAQACGIDPVKLDAPTELWKWDGTDLEVWGYPHNVHAMIVGGREGGKLGGRPIRNPKENPSETPNKPGGKPLANPERTQGSKEGSKKGRERTRAHARNGGAPVSVEQAQEWATGYSKGNVEMLIIEPVWVAAWHDHRAASGWMVVRSGVEMPIADWQADLRSWSRTEKLRSSIAGSGRVLDGAKKKEGAARHPLELEPEWDWKAVARTIAEEHGWAIDVIADSDWADLAPDHKQMLWEAQRGQ